MNNELPSIDIPMLLETLNDAARIVMTTHVNPDGDALGSEAAMYRFLSSRGADVRIINADVVPENLSLLEDDGMFETWDGGAHRDVLLDADCILCLDFNQSDRVRDMEETMLAGSGRRIVIDHHLNPQPFADAYLTVTEASSTAEIVYDVLVAAGVAIDRRTALALYVGIMTDTGSFRFERTTPRLHRITGDLLETGIDPMSIHRRIYDDYPIERTMLLGRILAGIERRCGGRASLLAVTREMFEETGTSVEDVENIVNYGLAVRGVELTALLTQVEDGWKVSFRSRGEIAVNDIAGEFGGGGHRLASGARVDNEDLGELKDRIAERFCRALGESR